MVILERVVDCPPLLYIVIVVALLQSLAMQRGATKCVLCLCTYGPKRCDVEQTKKLHCDKMFSYRNVLNWSRAEKVVKSGRRW